VSPEAQRIAIAEVCGWKLIRTGENPSPEWRGMWHDPSGTPIGFTPDYLSNLNAMHEAEKVLITQLKVRAYATLLCSICEHATPMVPVWHATASQRAEAFLRTIGKWEDDK
jgi:hypothetical protein